MSYLILILIYSEENIELDLKVSKMGQSFFCVQHLFKTIFIVQVNKWTIKYIMKWKKLSSFFFKDIFAKYYIS
jgi:hypothetical protein